MTPESKAYERWLNELSLDDVRDLFREHGAQSLLCKVLPQNANSKNQVYVASDLSQLSAIPSGEISPYESTLTKETGNRGPIFRAPIALFWLTPNGGTASASNSKFIAYPQYPEVRFSGFLKGCKAAPSFLFDKNQRGTEPDRLLLFGPRADASVLALALPPESAATKELHRATDFERIGVFYSIPLDGERPINGRMLLLSEICRIHRLGWVSSERLNGVGIRVPCNSSNCGGYTLESHLGIKTNGIAEPDFHGWEVKARSVSNIEIAGTSTVTLFTPEPDGGMYVTDGPEAFIRKWGYADSRGRDDRLNFGGVYRCGAGYHSRTQTRLLLDGYDNRSGLFRGDGSVNLVARDEVIAASWSFRKLIDHWKRKHAQAAYVPYTIRTNPARAFLYGQKILLGEGAEFRLLLAAIAAGVVYYDPGIKLENVSTSTPKLKRRSQFRVSSQSLRVLYQSLSVVSACTAISS